MKAIRVVLNKELLCVAGVPEFGVTNLQLNGMKRQASWSATGVADEDWSWGLVVSGLHSPRAGMQEDVMWNMSPFNIGDRLEVEIVESEETSEPQTRVEKPLEFDDRAAGQHYLAHLKDLQEKVEARLATLES